jgi:stage V sporulation protein R
MVHLKNLTPELKPIAYQIEAIAKDAGLDFFEVVFEGHDARDVNALAAYSGFPVRYASWRFGMEYERLEKGYSWGLSKIYELVINNDPTYAYLVKSNSLLEQKLVIAHVFGHADFFKHNVWFSPTERKMIDLMEAHAIRVRRYIEAVGQEEVERFLDLAMALDNLADPFLALRELRAGKPKRTGGNMADRARASFEAVSSGSIRRVPERQAYDGPSKPPTFDILGFLAEAADLEPWQRDIVRIVRAEAYYFMPQRMTKIMNEGWASFWHSRIMTRAVAGPDDIIDFADCHSGATMASPGQLNPYKMGIELFRHAERAGKDLFHLRAVHNDTSFIDTVIDEEFAERHGLYVYGKNQRTGRVEVIDRDWSKVKNQLLTNLAWGGLPRIELVDADHEGRGELFLRHRHDGRDLQLDAAAKTLEQVLELWGRPVHLLTQEEGQGRLLSADEDGVEVYETDEHGEVEKHPDDDDDDARRAS